MALFEDLYPDLVFSEEVNHRGDVLFLTQHPCQCLECNTFTRFMSISFMGHHCSEECNESAWEKLHKCYNEAEDKYGRPK
jgi:hypothetical protein